MATPTTTAVRQFMTVTPHGIEPNETLAVARERMNELKVRHLPVRSGGHVVGVISERDLYLLSSFPEVDFQKAKVGFAMTPDPYCVPPEATLRDVTGEMERRRIGSALVIDDQKRLMGIFTDTDALRILSSL